MAGVGIFRIASWISNISSDDLLEDFLVSAVGYFLILSVLNVRSVYGLILSLLGIFLFFYGFWLLNKAGYNGCCEGGYL
jgi:hypothetical protein